MEEAYPVLKRDYPLNEKNLDWWASDRASEIGYKQAMRYAETPGRWEPCVPYRPGDKAWASHA